MSWSGALLLPGSVVGRVGICPDISFLGSRALGQFVPVLRLHLDEGKLFLVLDATWLCCRSGTAARAGRVPGREGSSQSAGAAAAAAVLRGLNSTI